MASAIAKENRELSRRVAREVWSEGDLDVVDEIYAEDCVCHTFGATGDLHGPEGYKEWVREARTAIPDFELTLDEVFATDELTCGQWTARGTNDGDWETIGLEATGASIEYSGLFIDRIEDGRVVEEWVVPDGLTLMEQLGMLPEGAPA